MKHLVKLPLLIVAAIVGLGLAASASSAGVYEVHDGSGNPFSGEFAGFQEDGVLSGDLDVSCDEESSIMGSLSSPGALDGTVDVHFANCAALGGLVPCDVTLHDETLDFHILPINETEGHFEVEEKVEVHIDCSVVECEFHAEANTIEGHITEGAPAEVSFANQNLVSEVGPCADGAWTAHFLVNQPTGGLFLEHDEEL